MNRLAKIFNALLILLTCQYSVADELTKQNQVKKTLVPKHQLNKHDVYTGNQSMVSLNKNNVMHSFANTCAPNCKPGKFSKRK